MRCFVNLWCYLYYACQRKMTGIVADSPARQLRHLSLLQLLLLNAVVCGLEFCASAAFTYIPPLLLKSGLEEAHMSIILGVGPLLGFFLVPIIGRSSDNCKSKYGRRRPFILGLGLLLIVSLVTIPYGETFTIYAFGRHEFTKSLGIVLLIIGAVLLDFSSQACLTPCEALLSDACHNTTQQDRCFMVYSFMVSTGGCIGYLITALDWNSSFIGFYLGGQEQSAFTLLIILFTVTLFATLLVAQENPVEPEVAPSLEELQQEKISQKLDQIHQAIVRQKEVMVHGFGLSVNDPGYESGSNPSVNDEYQSQVSVPASSGQQAEALPLLGAHSLDKTPVSRFSRLKLCFKRQCNIPWTRWSFTTFDGFLHHLSLKLYFLLPQTIKSLLSVPFVLKRLALANFCSWTAVMGFNLFFTDFVGQAVFGGNPNAPEDSPERALYDEGVRMGSWGLLFHCITSAIYATLIERLVARYGLRMMYFIGMFSFTLAMAVMVFVRSILLVNIMAACTGFAYATLTTIPFMLVTQYHDNKEVSVFLNFLRYEI